jgi:hypothetical protein
MSPGHSNDQLIQTVRDEFSRLRGRMFQAIEMAGMRPKQESGWKGVMRSIAYDSQTSIEAALREAANGGNMAAPGITSQHVQAAYKTVYGPPEPAEEATAETAAETTAEATETAAAEEAGATAAKAK